MRTTILLFLCAILCFGLASCATPEQTGAAVVAAAGAAVTFIKQLAPVLSPEMQGKLMATASTIDGTVQATQMALGVVADAITQIKTTVGPQIQAVHDAGTKLASDMAQLPTRTEMWLNSTGVGSAAVGTSRVMSRIKHGPISLPRASAGTA